MVVTVNGTKFPAIAGSRAERLYVPFSGATCIAKSAGEGCLLTAVRNDVSLYYPDDGQSDSGPFAFTFSLPSDVSVLDDLIIDGCRDSLMLMNKRGFVLRSFNSL
jgi:hypothetical protein